MLKKILGCFVIGILLCFSAIPSSLADDVLEEEEDLEEVLQTVYETGEELNLNSRAAVIYDRSSKTILYGKNENERRPMASTTKIMTAIIVLEKGNLSDTVEVSKKAAGTGGSRLGLKAQDKISVKDLMYGLLLVSGNDAAVALAEYVGGSVAEFANLMNQKAEELGLKDTHFVTPHGLDQEQHYTTALELAKLADYAMQNQTFASIVNTKYYTVTMGGRTKNLSNTNELLGNLEGVNGVKTGFTNGANRCLVTSVNRSNMNIITVVLGADTKKMRTQDSVKLIQYAYQNYSTINLKDRIKKEFQNWEQTLLSQIQVQKGLGKLEVELEKTGDIFLSVLKKDEEDIEIKIETLSLLEAPIEKGEKIGEVQVIVDGEKKQMISILVKEEVTRKGVWDYLYEIMKQYPMFIENAIK